VEEEQANIEKTIEKRVHRTRFSHMAGQGKMHDASQKNVPQPRC